MQGGTLYGVIGNLFAWLLLAGLVGHAAYGWWLRRQSVMTPAAAVAKDERRGS